MMFLGGIIEGGVKRERLIVGEAQDRVVKERE